MASGEHRSAILHGIGVSGGLLAKRTVEVTFVSGLEQLKETTKTEILHDRQSKLHLLDPH